MGASVGNGRPATKYLSASGACVISCGSLAQSLGFLLSNCNNGSVRIKFLQFRNIRKFAAFFPSFPSMGRNHSFKLYHPITLSFCAFTSNIPLSANTSAALLPVSCLRLYKSGGAKYTSMRSPNAISFTAFAASEIIRPLWYTSLYTTARPASSTAMQYPASMSRP